MQLRHFLPVFRCFYYLLKYLLAKKNLMYKIILAILTIIIINHNSNAKTKTNTTNSQNTSKEASLSWIKEYKKYKLSKKEKNIIKKLANTKRILIMDIFGFKVYLKFNRQNNENTQHARFIETINEGNNLQRKLRD